VELKVGEMLPEIEVLMPILNGGKYLGAQLESLSSQEAVRIHLTVSDDGSSDDSMSVIQKYERGFASLRILKGPEKGVWENFSYLLKNRLGNLPIAFCDQDDIWHPKKLAQNLSQIDESSNVHFVFSRVVRSDTRGLEPKNWDAGPNSIYFGNPAMGCTQVFTETFAEIASKSNCPKDFPLDWWLYIVATHFCEVRGNSEPLLTYRIHENNAIGIPRFDARLKKIARSIPHFRSFTRIRLKAIENNLKSLDIAPSENLERIIFITSGNLMSRSKIFGLDKLRASRFEDLLLKFLLFIT
jgi:glycosyltransferase involved in cell wall biosynthesis